jgi:hypothetical protein
MGSAIPSKRRLAGCRIQHTLKGNIMSIAVTVASELNDKNLRADFPKMSDRAFECAVRLAAFVGKEMQAEPEDESAPTLREWFVPFAVLGRTFPRSVLHDIMITGPKFMDFMGVVNEVSGLAVVHASDGLWFFDMRERAKALSMIEYTPRGFAESYAKIENDTPIPQFYIDEDLDVDDGW